MKTQFTLCRCTKLWKIVYLSCWKISHICPVYKKVKNPTFVPLLYYHVCPKYLRIFFSTDEYCFPHELLIIDNSVFKRDDSTVNQIFAITHST
jgi:hypothetical protein